MQWQRSSRRMPRLMGVAATKVIRHTRTWLISITASQGCTLTNWDLIDPVYPTTLTCSKTASKANQLLPSHAYPPVPIATAQYPDTQDNTKLTQSPSCDNPSTTRMFFPLALLNSSRRKFRHITGCLIIPLRAATQGSIRKGIRFHQADCCLQTRP